MIGFDPAQKTGLGIIPLAAQPAAKPEEGASHGFFHDLWDVINPLQHLPVVSTLYRAATGTHIGAFEKIAGDTLYGGVWGAVSSVADTAFEAVTGKDFGSTVLALFGVSPEEKSKQLAAQPPATDAPAVVPTTSDVTALSNALAAKGVDSDLARRAMFAYQRANGLPGAAPAH